MDTVNVLHNNIIPMIICPTSTLPGSYLGIDSSAVSATFSGTSVGRSLLAGVLLYKNFFAESAL